MKRSLKSTSKTTSISEASVSATVEEVNNGMGAFFDDHDEHLDDNNETPVLDGSNPKKKRRKSAPAWQHYTEIKVDGSDWGQCNYCDK